MMVPFFLAHKLAMVTVYKLLAVARIVKRHYESHGLKLNFKDDKSETMINLIGVDV